jgi:Na+-driven multidrug efflux pump
VAFFNTQLGKPQVTAMVQVCSIVVNVAVALLLMPQLGELGSAWAKTAAYVTMLLTATGYFAYKTRYPWWKLFVLQKEEREQYKAVLTRVLGKVRGR